MEAEFSAENFTSIDVELANNDISSVCEIGAVRFRGGKLVETWRVMVNPDCEYEKLYHSQLHGITAKHTATAPSLAEVHGTLRSFLFEETCIFHGASNFDRNCLSEACKKSGVEDVTELATWVSTLVLAQQQWPDQPSHKLENLCKQIGHEYLPHNALEDAIAAAALYRALSGNTPTPAIRGAGGTDGRQRTFRIVPKGGRARGLKGNPNGPHFPTHIVLTGQFSDPWHERAELEFYLNDLGFIPRGNISGKTKILVTGAEAGQAKIEDALSRGIKVMTEDQFFTFLDGR